MNINAPQDVTRTKMPTKYLSIMRLTGSGLILSPAPLPVAPWCLLLDRNAKKNNNLRMSGKKMVERKGARGWGIV